MICNAPTWVEVVINTYLYFYLIRDNIPLAFRIEPVITINYIKKS